MSASPNRSPYIHPSAWKGSELTPEDWILRLNAADNQELATALHHAKARDAGIPGLQSADFPLPTLGPRIAAMQKDLVHGRGFKLIRGFDMHRYSVQDAALVYWGIGSHMGAGRAQNAQGDLLGHVTDLGVNLETDARSRGYQTNQLLPFHIDAQDVVGLLCVRTARAGGLSRIVSSTAIHNKLLETRPDLLEVMCHPFYFDRRGETPAGKKPYYSGPLFERKGDRLFGRYIRPYIESAQRFPEVPRMTDKQVEAMDLIDTLCNDPQMYLEMSLEPGDMQFVCNYTVMHSRTQYEDWPEMDRRRYLLRLWLDTGLVPDRPASWNDRFEDMDVWQKNPQPPIFDLSVRRNELAHG